MATMQFKYKVGDKVRVISKITECDKYRNFKMDNNRDQGWCMVNPMIDLAGKVVTIKELDVPQNCYHIDDTGLRWTDTMFEGLVMENNKIVITHDGKTTTATLYREDGSKEVATAKCCPEDTFDFNVGAKLAMERLMKKVAPVEEWRVVDRKARVGDYIRLKNSGGFHFSEAGDILKVDGLAGKLVWVYAKNHVRNTDSRPDKMWHYTTEEYEVVEKVTATEPKKPEPPKYFTGKVVCIENRINDGDFTVGKIYEIKDGNFTDNLGQIRPNTDGHNRVRNLSDLENEYYSNWHYKFIPIVE